MKNQNFINKAKPYIAYFNICILWGTSNVVAKIALSGINTSVFACIRYIITGLTLLSIAVLFRHEFPKGSHEWKKLITISVLMIFFTVGFIALGNKYADSGMVTVVIATVPIFTTIIECFIVRSCSIGKNGIIGLIGGFAGIIIMVLYGTASIKADFKGIIFSLLGAISWSAGSVYSKNNAVEGSIIAQTAAEGLFSAFLFFLVGKLSGDFVLTNITLKALIPVFYLAIFDSLIGFISYIYLLKIWKSSRVATYAYVNPVVALILGAAVLNEAITSGKVIGMIIIIASVFLIQRDKSNRIEEIVLSDKNTVA